MKISLLLAAICLSSLSAFAEVTLSEIADRLDGGGCWQSDARYEVLLPGAADPVEYRLKLLCEDALGDTLAPCDYLIEWSFTTPDGAAPSEGFSAYFDGNYFRFRGGKMMEYHHADDPKPFAPRGTAAGGVQMTDQFAPLLPRFLARRLRRMAADTAYVCTVASYPGEIVVKGSENRGGYQGSEFSYRFSDKTFNPLSWEIVTNPGQLGEQTITATYAGTPSTDGCPTIDEQALVERYPDRFARYRRDSFALEKLRGEPLPGFVAPTVSGERYSRRRGDRFTSPTVIAVLDSQVDGTEAVVATLRDAVASLPGTCELFIAFVDNDRDAIADIAGTARPGETVLASARELAANCGVTAVPAIIFCTADGTVADIHVGRNNDLRDIVIQKAALAR